MERSEILKVFFVAEVLAGYVDLLLAGLAGSPQLISGTLLALTRVMYEYKGK